MMKLVVLCLAMFVTVNAVFDPVPVPEDSEIGKLLKSSVTDALSRMYQVPYVLKKVREIKSEQTSNGLIFKLKLDFDMGSSQTKITSVQCDLEVEHNLAANSVKFTKNPFCSLL